MFMLRSSLLNSVWLDTTFTLTAYSSYYGNGNCPFGGNPGQRNQLHPICLIPKKQKKHIHWSTSLFCVVVCHRQFGLTQPSAGVQELKSKMLNAEFKEKPSLSRKKVDRTTVFIVVTNDDRQPTTDCQRTCATFGSMRYDLFTNSQLRVTCCFGPAHFTVPIPECECKNRTKMLANVISNTLISLGSQ